MTDAVWKCKKCGYEVVYPIYMCYFPQCQKCDAEYELLGTVWGWHAIHTVPIYRLKGDSFDDDMMPQPMAFLQGHTKPVIVCETREYYEYLKKKGNKNFDVEMEDREL